MDDHTTATEPVCSICIANYNGIDVIGPCLESIYAQEGTLPFEIIVHDDASTDESVAFIRTHYPDVTLITSSKNRGYCESNNRMVSRARGEFILLLNNDTTLHNDALKTLRTFALNHNEPAIISLAQYSMHTGELVDCGSFFDPFLNPVPNLGRECRTVGMVSGACLWISKVLWHELGGFPEWYQSIAEDTYLSCCARLRGYSVLAVAQSGFDHWIGKNIGGGKIVGGKLATTYRRRYLSERNKTFTLCVCYPSVAFYLFMPLHLLILSLEGYTLTLIKRDPKIWREIYGKALRALWDKKNHLMRKRSALQRNRRITTWKFFSVFVFYPYKIAMLFKHGLPSVKQIDDMRSAV